VFDFRTKFSHKQGARSNRGVTTYFGKPVLRQNVSSAENGANPCRERLNESRELSQECSADAKIRSGNSP
jgi:hypothetical protein